MQPLLSALLTALAVAFSLTTARAQVVADVLEVFTTTVPATAALMPGDPPAFGGWTLVAPGAAIAMPAGGPRWFAFKNTPDPDRQKQFRFDIVAVAPVGAGLFQLSHVDTSGYPGAGAVAAVGERLQFSLWTNARIRRDYTFVDQPQWERVVYDNPGAAIDVRVAAQSACCRFAPRWHENLVKVERLSIGSATPGAMYGNPRYTELWLFPTTQAVDAGAVHTIVAPPSSGSWSATTEYQTPTGEARPLGGVKWACNGPGLAPDEEVELDVVLQSSPADLGCDFFAYDASTVTLLDLPIIAPAYEPTRYCWPKLNSLGCLPIVDYAGLPSASEPSGFTVECSRVLNNKSGLLFYGLGGSAALPFQGGTMCVQPPVKRTPITASGGAPFGNDCSGVLAIDMNAFAAGSLGGAPAPELRQVGRTYHCQWWSRDPSGSFTTSLSDALECIVGI